VRTVSLLGSTGSIGTQAIDVIARNPDRFRVAAIAAGGGRPELLARQAAQLDVDVVGIADGSSVDALHVALTDAGASPKVLVGDDAAAEIAGLSCDTVLNGMDGAAGLRPTLKALEAGNTLALANKESLIIGGDLVMHRAGPGQIVPVDSEHSALAQCLRGGRHAEVRRLILTASGGPFRGRRRDDLGDVTIADALAHPTWDMGPLVTMNSATLVNKGLEVIEAHLLFDIPMDRIDVVVHPQSIVHSMVEFVDGSTLAQVSPPDMRLPIALGLSWPERVPDAGPSIDWTHAAQWDFMPLDAEAFPAVRLARQAGRTAGTAPAVFNGANETAVAAFLDGRVGFLAIVDTIERVLADHLAQDLAQVLAQDLAQRPQQSSPQGEDDHTSGGTAHREQSLTVEAVLDADRWARGRAAELLTSGAAQVSPNDRGERGER